jgi:hypothetical protein
MWMDAADDTTFSYSSGTTVSQWRDKSGFNYHMTPLAGSPTRNAFLNSRKVLAFTTGQDIQNLSIDLRTSPYTVFIISRYTSPSAGTGRILTSNGGYNNWLLGHWASETNKYYANGWVYSTYVALDTNWKMYLGDWGGPSNDLANFYGAGTAIATNSADASAGPWTLGINANSGERSNCEAAEIIVFNRLLSTVERRLVHTYLGQKWGISNSDRQIFDLSGNNYNFIFQGANPRYNSKTFISNFNTTNPFAVSSFGGQNLTSNILNLLYADHTIEVAFNAKGFRSVYSYDNTLTTQDGQAIVIWTGRHSGLRVSQNQILYEYWNSQSTVVGIAVNISSYIDKIMYITATRTGDVLRLYINGVLASGPTTVAATTSPVSYSQINIGAAYQGNPTTQGYIWASQHEYHLLRMYNKALNSSEVVSNYQAFKARFDNNIVRFGLVLDLDAGNPTSYAGSGTTWYDVSGNSNNSTLTFGPTYSTTNGGIINFDGVDDYSVSTVASITASSTIGLWIKCASYDNKIPISIAGAVYGSGPNIFFYNSTINWNIGDGGGNPFTNSYYPNSNWHYIVITNDSATNAKLYIDGVLIGTAAYRNTASTNSNNFWIGRFSGNNDYTINASIGQVQLYNRVLSATEALQNYNATKGRFGL